MKDDEAQVILLRQENAWLRQQRDEALQESARLRAYLEAHCINADTGEVRRRAMGGRQ